MVQDFIARRASKKYARKLNVIVEIGQVEQTDKPVVPTNGL